MMPGKRSTAASAFDTVGLEMMIARALLQLAIASRWTTPMRPAPTTPTLRVPLSRSMRGANARAAAGERSDIGGATSAPKQAAAA